jgi:hypothetical protein
MPESIISPLIWCWLDSDTVLVGLDCRCATLDVDTGDGRVTADLATGDLDETTFAEIVEDITRYADGRRTVYCTDVVRNGDEMERTLLADFAALTCGAV